MPSGDNEDSIPTRDSLLSRLKNWEDQLSWREFFDCYWRLVYNVARKAGLSAVEAEDVVQETVLSVAKGIGSFKKSRKLGRFKAWLLNIAHWRIVDQFRKRAPGGPGGQLRSGAPVTDQVPDPATLDLGARLEETWNRQLLEVALSRVRSTVRPLSYQMFELHVLKDWPAAKVAERLKVSIGRVYFAKYKISRAMRKEIRVLNRCEL